MTHFRQATPSSEQEPFDFNQIFIGREQQIAEFERILQDWMRIMAHSEIDGSSLTDLPSPGNKLQGLVVLLYGRGGFGKSTLLQRYYKIAVRENEQGHRGKLLLCGPVDWEFAVEGRRGTYNPSQGQFIDASAYFKDLCGQLAAKLNRQAKDFHTYQQAAVDVERARKEANKVLEEVKRDGSDMGSTLRGATVEIVASAISTYVPGSKPIVENDKVKKGAEALLQLTGEQLVYFNQMLHNRLGERLGDYLDPARRLGLALGNDLRILARNYPILIFFDTYEEVDEGDVLLRVVMGAAGVRVGWIIAGRDNLWSGPGQRERSIVPEYGYRDIVSFDRGLSVNFNSEDVGAFTPDNIREYFQQLCQHFPCQPPLPALTQNEIAQIWDVSKGIPLAVNIAAALYSETAEIEKVTEEVEGKKEIIDKMVYRYLQHTRIDESERAKLYALALLRRTDQPDILATALGLTREEAKTQYKEALSHLHRRYSFIFTEKGEPSLHQEVRDFLRLFLLERRKQPDIRNITSQLKEAHETALNDLEKQREYSTLKERMQDEEWTGIYLDLTEQYFWLDPVEGLRYILPFMIAASIYRRDINKEAKQIGTFFAFSFLSRNKNRWNWASESLVYLHNRNPSLKVLQDLEELNKLMDQQLKYPTYLNYPEELEAALWVRLGEAYRFSDDSRALEWYEKAFTRLKQEDELKESLAEACYEYGNKLRSEKKYVESIRLLKRAIELISNYTNAYNNRGIAYYEQQEYAFAIADYDSAIRLNPEYALAYYNRGLAHRKQEEYALAIADYDSAIRLNPEYALAYYGRGLAYYEQQEYALAIVDYDTAIRLNPEYALAYYNRGLAYYNQQEYALAITDYDTAIRLNPEYALAYYGRGLAYYDQQEYALAIADYDTAIRFNPQDPDAYYNRGDAYYDQQEYALAIADYDTAIHLNPQDPDAYNSRGDAYYDQQEYLLAIADYDTAIHLNPQDPDAYNSRGDAYYEQQEYLLAITDYSQALKLNPDYNVYSNRGYAYLFLKNVEQARADFIKGVEREPNDVNMAWMVIFTSLQKERPNRAVAERLEEIALIDLQTYEAQICLGVASGLRGKLKDGLAKLDEALQIEPESQDANFWKGMLSAYYYQRRPQIAVEAIEKALANGLPPVLLTPLYWMEKDTAQFFVQYAKPILERYGM